MLNNRANTIALMVAPNAQAFGVMHGPGSWAGLTSLIQTSNAGVATARGLQLASCMLSHGCHADLKFRGMQAQKGKRGMTTVTSQTVLYWLV